MTDSLNIVGENDIQTINLDLDLNTSTNNDSLGIELLADQKKQQKQTVIVVVKKKHHHQKRMNLIFSMIMILKI